MVEVVDCSDRFWFVLFFVFFCFFAKVSRSEKLVEVEEYNGGGYESTSILLRLLPYSTNVSFRVMVVAFAVAAVGQAAAPSWCPDFCCS